MDKAAKEQLINEMYNRTIKAIGVYTEYSNSTVVQTAKLCRTKCLQVKKQMLKEL